MVKISLFCYQNYFNIIKVKEIKVKLPKRERRKENE